MYLTVNEAYRNNPKISSIFNNVSKYFDLGIVGIELFRILNYENPNRIFNYVFGDSVLEIDIRAIANYVDYFCQMYQYKYGNLLKTTQLKYNPIENYNRTEHDSVLRQPALTYSENVTHTDDTQTETGGTVNNSADINTENINGTTTYDDVNFTNTEKTNGTTDEKTQITSDASEHRISSNSTLINKNDGGTDTTTTDVVINGNIGVTTSQQMIDAERKIVDFSVVHQFLNDISNYILLTVYK